MFVSPDAGVLLIASNLPQVPAGKILRDVVDSERRQARSRRAVPIRSRWSRHAHPARSGRICHHGCGRRNSGKRRRRGPAHLHAVHRRGAAVSRTSNALLPRSIMKAWLDPAAPRRFRSRCWWSSRPPSCCPKSSSDSGSRHRRRDPGRHPDRSVRAGMDGAQRGPHASSSDLGVMFLLFRVGLEVKASELMKLGGTALLVGDGRRHPAVLHGVGNLPALGRTAAREHLHGRRDGGDQRGDHGAGAGRARSASYPRQQNHPRRGGGGRRPRTDRPRVRQRDGARVRCSYLDLAITACARHGLHRCSSRSSARALRGGSSRACKSKMVWRKPSSRWR